MTLDVYKGTKCVLTNLGHYNFYYMSNYITEFNRDCIVRTKPFVDSQNKNFLAVETEMKNIGLYENESTNNESIIVWIEK
jgi:hypothetical protein